MNRFIRWLIPPDRWKTPAVMVLGTFFGLSAFIVNIPNAFSSVT
ncbi:MAG: hypothetical protein Q8867_01095 [Bacteroidota bacterium]|nr:hypothetical protein [Bacteroidota bacterium]